MPTANYILDNGRNLNRFKLSQIAELAEVDRRRLALVGATLR